MNYYRKIEFDGQVYVTKDFYFEQRMVNKKLGRKRVRFFFDGRMNIYIEKKIIVAKFKCLGAFKDKACTQKVKI